MFSYYTYNQRSYVPKPSSACYDSDYSSSQPSSPLSYSEVSDHELEEEEEHPQEYNPMNQINNKKELINIMILVLSDNLNTKFNLNLDKNQVNNLRNLIVMLTMKCHLSLSNVSKNVLILEKILLHNHSSVSLNLLKRMVLTSFIVGDADEDSDHFSKWHTMTGLPVSLLRDDCTTFTNQFSIGAEISDVEVANYNKLLQYQVENYVRVI